MKSASMNTNIIAYCQQNRYVQPAICTDILNPQSGYLETDAYLLNLVSHNF